MSEQYEGSCAESVAQRVAHQMGGLTPDEFAVAYGAAAALETYSPEQLSQPRIVSGLVQAVARLRSGPCGWCGGDMTGHAIDIGDSGVEVRCFLDSQHWPVDVWALGPAPAPTYRTLFALLCWPLLPFVTLGLLSWAMPLTAGVMRKRRAWILGAAVLFIFLVAGLALPETAGGFFLIAAWLGGSAYGALQVKPWLRSFPQRAALPELRGSQGPKHAARIEGGYVRG